MDRAMEVVRDEHAPKMEVANCRDMASASRVGHAGKVPRPVLLGMQRGKGGTGVQVCRAAQHAGATKKRAMSEVQRGSVVAS